MLNHESLRSGKEVDQNRRSVSRSRDDLIFRVQRVFRQFVANSFLIVANKEKFSGESRRIPRLIGVGVVDCFVFEAEPAQGIPDRLHRPDVLFRSQQELSCSPGEIGIEDPPLGLSIFQGTSKMRTA